MNDEIEGLLIQAAGAFPKDLGFLVGENNE